MLAHLVLWKNTKVRGDAYFYESSMQKLVEEESVLTLLDVGTYDGLSVKQMGNVFGARLKIVHAF